MATKKKRTNVPPMGTLVALLIALIPIWFFGSWIKDAAQQENQNESGYDVVEKQLPNYYELCDEASTQSSDSVVEIERGLIPQVIKIPSVQIDLPIASVPLSQGTWKVYDDVANYAQGTSLINPNTGNVGIYGHDLKSVFSSIKSLTQQDEIELYSQNYKAIYKVVESDVSEPDEVSVFYETQEPTLTLVTCEGNLAQRRYIIRAKFDRIVELNCE